MDMDDLSNRWYDKDPKMMQVLDLLSDLPPEAQEELGATLIQLVNMWRKSRKEDEIPLSIGKNRVLGLYKASQKRRWYDKNSVLMSAMNVISTLPIDECKVISEGLLYTIKVEGCNS